MDLKNHEKNIDLFKGHVKGARLTRGKGIPNQNVIHYSVSKDPTIKVLANIQGSNNAKYVIDIFEENGNFTIVHDCPDFQKNFRFCKHVIKVLLLLEPDICQAICSNIHNIKFSSNFNLVKQSKAENFILKAEELVKKTNYCEAINFLEQAYKESNNFSCIEKIEDIALKYRLYDQFLKFGIRFDALIKANYTKLPAILNDLIKGLEKHDFYQQAEIIINLNTLLKSFNDQQFSYIFQTLTLPTKNSMLKFLLLNNLPIHSSVDKLFPELQDIPGVNIKARIEQLITNSINEAILNMDSIENVEAYSRIAEMCHLSNKNTIFNLVRSYQERLKALFIEGLKQKHAFLRSLVIENTKSDKLPQINFRYKYEYPTLVWCSIKRSESSLYYYVIEKCGIERHHLEYADQSFFIENFPVFKEIFDGNNPIGNKVKNFWGTEDPKIKNVVKTTEIPELNYEINIKELDKYLLIEWDLAQRPILGSFICQFSDGFIIPDKNHPLTNEIKPFDLTLCYKKPLEIKAGNIKILHPVRRINFKTAIELIWKGLNFVSSHVPFEVIKSLKKYEVDELDAYDQIGQKFETSFIPDKDNIKIAFIQFIQSRILRELNKIYLAVLERPDYKKKVLRMIGFTRYIKVFNNKSTLDKFKQDTLKRESLQLLKIDLKNEIGKILTDLIKSESYEEINLEELKKFPVFRKWALKLILELKKKLENCKIYKEADSKYNLYEFSKNYYGKILLEQLIKSGIPVDSNSESNDILIEEKFLEKLIESYDLLKLSPPQIIDYQKNGKDKN